MGLVVDCGVHPHFSDLTEIRGYMREPLSSKGFSGLGRILYEHPGEEFWRPAVTESGLPGSDPATLRRILFDEGEVDLAVLLPLTRNLQPDLDVEAAICAATNDWLAETWLDRENSDGRFRGSIRVCPREPAKAVREIERWAGHPAMVQVAVPLQAQHPYGQRQYFPVWEAAARHGLPVAVHSDGGFGVELMPTSAGYVRHFVEYSSLFALNYTYHLSSLIAEGVFDRLEDLTFVFADGGYDVLAALGSRLDYVWRASHHELPWVKQLPTLYYRGHVRFVTSRLEGPPDPAAREDWLQMGDAEHLLMFGSNYPYWDYDDPLAASGRFVGGRGAQIMGGNAERLYRLTAPTAPSMR